MNNIMIFFFSLIVFAPLTLHSAEVSFIAANALTHRPVIAAGNSIDLRESPCSTFKIPLSLIGYDVGILCDENRPVWPYDGSEVPLESHRASQSPKSWMSLSVVWYSKRLARQIGLSRLQQYVSEFSYGNMDVSGGGESLDAFVSAHLCSSLKISPREQVGFLEKLLSDELFVSKHALRTTKNLLFEQAYSSGWKLFGKTGTGRYSNPRLVIAWYIGWIEKAGELYPFALLFRDHNADAFPTKLERQQLVRQYFNNYGIVL